MREKGDDRLEFNDGVGDMLRPREKEGFGWFSTVLIVGLSLIVILLSFWISFNVGKRIFLKDTGPVAADEGVWDLPEPAERSSELASEADQEATAAPERPDEELLPPEKAEYTAPAPKKTSPAPAKPVAAPISAPAPAAVSAAKLAAAAPVPAPVAKISPLPSAHLKRVIVGSFPMTGDAQQMVADLKGLGIPSFVRTEMVGSKKLYRVQAGAFSTTEKASSLVNRLKQLGYDAFIMQ